MKKKRLQAIREILSSQQIGSQEELLRILSLKGFSVTQATLSRDIRELQVARRPSRDGAGYIYTLDNMTPVLPITDSRLKILSLEFSGQLAVAKTRPANASSVAAEIDALEFPGILGTIAGDDTILVILRENVAREKIERVLKPMR